tara:strand:- start:424 stop:594 length:171 start_codon:yes stop_codon:yes gene_type:complete
MSCRLSVTFGIISSYSGLIFFEFAYFDYANRQLSKLAVAFIAFSLEVIKALDKLVQ